MENYNKSMSANTNRQLSKEEYRKLCSSTRERRKALFTAIKTKVGFDNVWTSNDKKRIIVYNLVSNKSKWKYITIKFDDGIANQNGFVSENILEEILDILNTKNNGYELLKLSNSDWKWFKNNSSPFIQFKQFENYEKN